MSRLVRKYAPLLVTLALMAWCCWSQIHESEPLLANIDEAQLPQIQRHALRPEISPLSQRDPFLPPEPEPEPVAVNAPLEPVSEDPPEPLFDPRTVLSGFRLDAIMVGTEYPVAMINGHVYGEGELIALEGRPELRCKLRRVQADRAVLEIEEEEYEILFSQTSPPPQQITEPQQESPQESTTQRQLESAADPLEMEYSLAKLLHLLKAAVPNLGEDLEWLLDQSPAPQPTTNEIANPTTKPDYHDHPLTPVETPAPNDE